MPSLYLPTLALLASAIAQSSYSVPSTPPSTNTSFALEPAPVGISFEFFAWPGWEALESTTQCLKNLGKLSGTMPPIRIGGTTQDRATYDPNLKAAVAYTVDSPTDAPASLTYGKKFFQLASKYGGDVTVGLNRRLDNLYNTIIATQQAMRTIKNFYAVELGNEPDYYGGSSPIAQDEFQGTWTPLQDAYSQYYWQTQVGKALNTTEFVQAGVRLNLGGGFTAAELSVHEGSALQYVRNYGMHSYPQSACGGNPTYLDTLMSHSSIYTYMQQYFFDLSYATAQNKAYIISETNSATCGGGGISSAFGAALWIVDYVLLGLSGGVDGFRFHHGTIGNSPYDWWGYNFTTSTNLTYATYYGAYFVSAALAGSTYVTVLDNGSTPYATYILYNSNHQPIKAVLYNSDYYTGGANRTSQTFQLTNLPISNGLVTALRLTAPSATSKVEFGENPSIGGGLRFDNATCKPVGKSVEEVVMVSNYSASFVVQASEALLVTFVA